MRRPNHQLLCGDSLEMLGSIADETVQTCVTSPPYKDLRDYGLPEQIGLGETVEEYLGKLWAVFDEVWRVLRTDGTCWVNIGDSYAGSGKGPTGHNGIGNQTQRQGFTGHGKTSAFVLGNRSVASQKRSAGVMDVPAKSLAMIPERFAWGMIERGWILRSRIAWCKRSAMPESVTDRPTSAWEHVWLFSKSPRYYYDAEAVRQPQGWETESRRKRADRRLKPGRDLAYNGNVPQGIHTTEATGGANLRNYWLLGPDPSKAKHYAAFPRELPRRCILAGTSAAGQCVECGSPWVRVVVASGGTIGQSWHDHSDDLGIGAQQGSSKRAGTMQNGTYKRETIGWQSQCRCDSETAPQIVIDPFVGTGTTSVVADELGRDSIGIDLVPQYIDMASQRLRGIRRVEGVTRERR